MMHAKGMEGSRMACLDMAATLALGSCNAPTSANKVNFERALNARLSHACVKAWLYESVAHSIEPNSGFFPLSVDTDWLKRVPAQAAAYNSLTKAGLLVVDDVPMDARSSSRATKPSAKRYTLTPMGVRAQPDPHCAAFCVGHYKVDQITGFTTPSNVLGATISVVSYTYCPVSVPAGQMTRRSRRRFQTPVNS